MRKTITALAFTGLWTVAAWGGQTATLLKTRLASGQSAKPGVWLANFSKAKTYATKKGVPLVAVWSNGDACGHCVAFESSVNSSYFRKWMKTSGCVFYFTYSGESQGEVGGSVFHWCRKNKNTSYPFVRIYWPKGGVDVATVGDTVDGNKDGTTGGKKCVAYIKKKCAKFFAKTVVVKPYTIAFEPNGATNEMPFVRTKVGATLNLPACTLKYPDHSFAGWAKTASGTVAYKNKASVKNLTTVSNGVVTLYARWTRTTFRTYYVGVKCTITLQSGLKGWTTSTKIPGLKWTSSTYRWTGTSTKAGTYTVKFKKGSSSTTRKIVVAKDAVKFVDEGALPRVWGREDEILLELAPYSAVGQPKSVTVSGLPDGLSYDAEKGVVAGVSTRAGTFKTMVTIVSAKGQKLTRAFNLAIGVPDICIGTFNGFVGSADPTRLDELAFLNRGTFRLSAPSNASLSAKVVTAKGSYSFSSVGWLLNGDGTYTADLVSAGGKDRLTVTVDEQTPPNKAIAPIGTFIPSYGTMYEVWAQRAPFARDATGRYVDPVMEAAMERIVGKWYFKAYPVGSQWILGYATSKSANLTLSVDADGFTKLAGTLGTYKVSASASVFVFAGDVETGFVRADFPVPVTVGKTKKTLDIWTNLWFDRASSHFDSRGEGIGGAMIRSFE